jgi:arsenate reductase (thioredoxin)
MSEPTQRILVLCTGNSCRSQMAEGYLQHLAGRQARVYSAGIEAHGVNPLAVEAMQDDGIDISHQTSNLVSDYAGMDFDWVITVCDNAQERCPHFPSKAQRLHQNFPDPAKASGTEEEIAAAFRHTRQLIRAFCENFVKTQFA